MKDGLPVFTGGPSFNHTGVPLFVKNNDIDTKKIFGLKEPKKKENIESDIIKLDIKTKEPKKKENIEPDIIKLDIKTKKEKQDVDIIISDILNPENKITKTSEIYKFKSPFSKL